MLSFLQIIVTVLSLGVSFVDAFGTEKEMGEITLADAKKYAIKNNFEITSLRRSVDELKANAQRARSVFFPTLGVAGGLDSELSANSSDAGMIGYVYGQYNIFNGYRDTFESRISELEIKRAEYELAQAEFRIGLEIEEQFHAALYNKIQVESTRAAAELNEKHKKSVQRKRMAGAIGESDVLEFELKESLLQSDLQALIQESEIAKLNLRRLLGEDIAERMEPIGNLRHMHLKTSLMKCLEKVREKNTKVLLSARDVEAAQVASKVAQSRWLPRVDLEARMGLLPLDARPEKDSASANFQIVAKLDLFNGFDTRWENESVNARILKTEARLKEDILVTLSKIEELYRKARAIQDRVDLEEKNAQRAQRYYNSVMKEYGRGFKNSADVSAASEGLFETKLRRERFKYEFLTLLVELQKTIGDSVETEVIDE